jgi:hypothetical protein
MNLKLMAWATGHTFQEAWSPDVSNSITHNTEVRTVTAVSSFSLIVSTILVGASPDASPMYEKNNTPKMGFQRTYIKYETFTGHSTNHSFIPGR